MKSNYNNPNTLSQRDSNVTPPPPIHCHFGKPAILEPLPLRKARRNSWAPLPVPVGRDSTPNNSSEGSQSTSRNVRGSSLLVESSHQPNAEFKRVSLASDTSPLSHLSSRTGESTSSLTNSYQKPLISDIVTPPSPVKCTFLNKVQHSRKSYLHSGVPTHSEGHSLQYARTHRGSPHFPPIHPIDHNSTTQRDMYFEDYSDVESLHSTVDGMLDPSGWLAGEMLHEECEGEQDSSRPIPAVLRVLFYDPLYPEFTSIQQFSWAVILGVLMGVYTACWKELIEFCVEFVWVTTPKTILHWGLFSDLDGWFPVYHYMWITPAIFGGTLSYIFAALNTKIPSQNDWIDSLHSRGVQNSDTFCLLFLLSTAGMASGLSLGPELPLILTAGMIGSWLGIVTKQSVLSARVLNLTAASAAVGGFFGFPMAGALFVLEVPHRMGLQYFEALSPATIASIVAVLTNRLVTGNDVSGYYRYPFLNTTLPSSIFHNAIVFGVFGGVIGIVYAKAVLVIKAKAHDTFKHDNDLSSGGVCSEENSREREMEGETTPLFGTKTFRASNNKGMPQVSTINGSSTFTIAHKQTRSGVVGVIVGAVVGLVCIFVPHVMFWGESQLQNLIDKGRTPLPVFRRGDDPTSGLTSLGLCLVDSQSDGNAGFSLGCSALIASAKILVTGLSLGTGIVGGHFWAPLFVGCAASHFLTDLVDTISNISGISFSLSTYPCVALLCTMGSTHVVTFRAHIAIILILTLTIDAFDPENGVAGSFKVAGDYSAVFPLLTVSVFVALQISRQTIFYEKQRSRGDIMALPEVLCEPGKEGQPLVMDYDSVDHILDQSDFDYESDTEEEDLQPLSNYHTIDGATTQHDIEAQFKACIAARESATRLSFSGKVKAPAEQMSSPLPPRHKEGTLKRSPLKSYISASPREIMASQDQIHAGMQAAKSDHQFPYSKVDDSFKAPVQLKTTKKAHRRTQSDPLGEGDMSNKMDGLLGISKPLRGRSASTVSASAGHGRLLPPVVALKRVSSFGEVDQEQPSLLDQARRRSASFASAESKKAQKRLSSAEGGSHKLPMQKGSQQPSHI